MNIQSNLGLAIFAVGVLGLVVCNVAVSHAMPNDWFARRRRRRAQRIEPVQATHRPVRRSITGPSAAERLGEGSRPARHRAFRPDDLTRERQRLAVDESRREVEKLLDQHPERLAEVVDHWLSQDRSETADDPRSKN